MWNGWLGGAGQRRTGGARLGAGVRAVLLAPGGAAWWAGRVAAGGVPGVRRRWCGGARRAGRSRGGRDRGDRGRADCGRRRFRWRRRLGGGGVVAVDLPSGVDADTGEVWGCWRADVTVTFGAYKPGLLIDPGGSTRGGAVRRHRAGGRAGGSPRAEGCSMRMWRGCCRCRERRATSTGGVVGIAAGSARYPGAAVLAVGGALRVARGRAVRGAGGRCGSGSVSRDAGVRARPTGRAGAGVGRRAGGRGRRGDGGEVLAADVPVLDGRVAAGGGGEWGGGCLR
ncbi:NAD(P)H-hydrate epimerase [Streptomyces sp. MNU103]|uniref:NAD(P)H-hydrate epimerase n=1 Tax=Streptomyces sp. MNU103 TaxID=2560024 RepID=UPI001E369D3A|nr:hypothetical protein [Streptomyces sp. MNU103]